MSLIGSIGAIAGQVGDPLSAYAWVLRHEIEKAEDAGGDFPSDAEAIAQVTAFKGTLHLIQTTPANRANYASATNSLNPDGANDFYNISNNSISDQEFTFYFIAKFGSGQRAFTNNNQNGYGGWLVERNVSTGVIVFASIANNGAGLDVLQTASSYNDGNFHLVTVRKIQSGDLQLWVDDTLEDTIVSSSDLVFTGMISGGDTIQPSLFRWRSSSPLYYGSPWQAHLYIDNAQSDIALGVVNQLLIDKYSI